MADQDKPRVRLPDAIPRKPLTPGPNSWAQAQQQEQQRSSSGEHFGIGQVTNRNKYEHKPMPPSPPVDSTSHKKHIQAKAYIQPAIPLLNPKVGARSQKMQAVTEPIASKPLFLGREVSVVKPRKKFSFSKAKDTCLESELVPTDQSPPNAQLASEKAAEVLGLYPPPEKKSHTPPVSTFAPVSDPFRSSSDSVDATTTISRQPQSIPAPTRRYLKENDLPTPAITEAPVVSDWNPDVYPSSQNKDSKKIEDGAITSGMLHPPKIGKYGNVSEVGLVETKGMPRIESFRGIIESAESPSSHDGTMYASSTGALSLPRMTQGLTSEGLLPPISYSPSNYGGVWENDLAVGYSLPPFSPVSNGLPPNNEGLRNSLFDQRDRPVMPTKHSYDNSDHANLHLGVNGRGVPNTNPDTDLPSDYHHPFPSANSWVSGNSNTSTNAPLSVHLPPSWPGSHSNNSIPSPPQNQHDYQSLGSMSTTIARLELTLHHHIDSTTGSLSRLITERHDRIIDQTVRRLEDIEETMNKGLRNLKIDFEHIRKGFDGLTREFKTVMESSDRLQDLLSGLDGKINALEKGVKEHEKVWQLKSTAWSPSTGENGRHHGAARHRRTESAHDAFDQGGQRQQYRSGASRSSTSAHHSENSNRAHRSNTLKSQATNGISDEIGARREYFAELGAAKGPMPDLRDHPAFSSMQQTQGQNYDLDQNIIPSILNGLPFEHPSLSDGRWYQQAYGQSQLMER